MKQALSAAGVRRARVQAHNLGGEAVVKAVPDLLRHVVGIQAQDVAAAALSMRPRSPGLASADLFSAVAAGEVALTWSLRGTRHLHAAGDIRWLVSLFGPLFGQAARRARQLGIDGELGERAQDSLRQALGAEGPLTRAEIKERLQRLGIDVTGQAAAHVIRRAGLAGSLCVIPAPHGKERYAPLELCIPAPQDPPQGSLDTEQALPGLARRYLAAYGPATPNDFRAWSGLPAALARRAWSAIGPEMVELAGPSGPLWVLAVRQDPVRAAAAGGPAPLRLLGGFDTLLLGYADRSLLLAPEHAWAINPGGGILHPVVLEDGQVVGTWRYQRARRPHSIDVTALQPMDPHQLAREGAAVGQFLGSEVVVRTL
ncbi:MAG: winged helix DNA-binding domain-containing protein [Actinomycetota bacterium]